MKNKDLDKFEVPLVKFANLEVYIPQQVEYLSLIESSNILIELVSKVIQSSVGIKRLVADSLNIKKKMKGIDAYLSYFDKKLTFFKIALTEDDKKSKCGN
jgi:hypothetical protein